jgi:hypothetical protein
MSTYDEEVSCLRMYLLAKSVIFMAGMLVVYHVYRFRTSEVVISIEFNISYNMFFLCIHCVYICQAPLQAGIAQAHPQTLDIRLWRVSCICMLLAMKRECQPRRAVCQTTTVASPASELGAAATVDVNTSRLV